MTPEESIEHWRGGIDARLDEIRDDVKDVKTEIFQIHQRQIDNPYIERAEYQAKHEDLERRLVRLETVVANLQGRGIVVAALCSILLAGLVSLLANHV